MNEDARQYEELTDDERQKDEAAMSWLINNRTSANITHVLKNWPMRLQMTNCFQGIVAGHDWPERTSKIALEVISMLEERGVILRRKAYRHD